MSDGNVKSRREFLKTIAVAGGAAGLGACAGSQLNEESSNSQSFIQSHARNSFPKHNERTKGWMRFMWQKATTPDDWGYSADIERPWGINPVASRGPIDFTVDGRGPHPWWDQYSAPPYLSYPRFDLADSSYPIMLMADQTPAWREVYTRIMDELATRHTAYWAAIDWNTFIGANPERQNYGPGDAMYAFWPERLRGNYDAAGWTANGVEPWGLQPDPIGADGNLFFRGWLNLVLSIYKYVSGDDKWEKPWQIAGYENQKFEWTQPKIVEHLHRQYTANPEGPQCENTKIWPSCNSAAGLGMYLSDQLAVTNAHGVFQNWVEFMKDNYMSINSQNQIEWMTAYYDPLADFKVNLPGTAGAGIMSAFYLMPQSPEIATQIYDAAARTSGWRDPKREIQPDPIGQVLAKALGDHTAVERLTAAAERFSEPRWFGEDMDKFGWFFNNGEPWPRGQTCARQMVSEIAEGNWIEAFKVKHMDKYTAPTVEGVDYPSIGIDTAWNDKANGVLNVGTYVADRNAAGRPTNWRITNLPNASEAVVICDGSAISNFRILDQNTISVPTDIGNHSFQIYTGYFGQELNVVKPYQSVPEGGINVAAVKRTAEQNAKAAESVFVANGAGCPCCAGAS